MNGSRRVPAARASHPSTQSARGWSVHGQRTATTRSAHAVSTPTAHGRRTATTRPARGWHAASARPAHVWGLGGRHMFAHGQHASTSTGRGQHTVSIRPAHGRLTHLERACGRRACTRRRTHPHPSPNLRPGLVGGGGGGGWCHARARNARRDVLDQGPNRRAVALAGHRTNPALKRPNRSSTRQPIWFRLVSFGFLHCCALTLHDTSPMWAPSTRTVRRRASDIKKGANTLRIPPSYLPFVSHRSLAGCWRAASSGRRWTPGRGAAPRHPALPGRVCKKVR